MALSARAHRVSTGGLAELAAGLRGSVLRPGDLDYDEARRVHDLAVDRHPAAIVRAADAGDVVAAVDLARASGSPLAIRSGGHSMAGHGTVDEGILLDVSGLDAVEVHPGRGVAWAGAGTRAGAFVAATAVHGLTTPLGDTATVGLGGLTLGGGVGWLARKHGLTIDNLLAVDLVTADGQMVRASEFENQDLFWALRGGGGNFGVATRFLFRLHPVATVLGGALVLPLSRDVLRAHGPIAGDAPDELTTIAVAMAGLPPLPFVPAEQHGRPGFAVLLVHAGDPEAGRAAVAPYRAVARPIADAVAAMPYPAVYSLTEGASEPGRSAHGCVYLPALDERAVDAILDALARPSSPMAMVQLRVLGGAVARVAAGDTAYARRDRSVMVVVVVPYLDPAEADRHQAWTAALLGALRDVGAAGTYVNFLGDEGPGRVREAYPGGAFERLALVKRRWDPANLFRLNQNVPPAA
ncbi:MAG: FAD-binding oxidoreductase [Chloroflexi bacterium]|nr:FAD-binding oxidoreductase [Chloroflexota bacterium]